MIKWPEPVAYRKIFPNGYYSLFHQNVGWKDTSGFEPLHTEAQLKQAVRDALQHAIDEIKAEADYSGSNRKAVLTWSIDKLRALIKEIE